MYKISDLSSYYLDILRVISVQMVVIGHGISYCSLFLFLQPPNFVYLQRVAVVIFFLLSGFLITYTTVRKTSGSEYSFPLYFIDRFSRIYSGLIPALLFVACVDFFFSMRYPDAYAVFLPAYNIQTFFGNCFMLQDFPFQPFNDPITSFGSAKPLWTLAIEWWIYMAIGWIILRDRIRLNFSLYFTILLAFSVVPLFNFSGGGGNGLFLMWLFGSAVFLVLNAGYIRYKRTQLLCFLGISLILAAGWLILSKWQAYNLLFAGLLGSVILFSILLLDTVQRPIRIPRNGVHTVAGFSYTLYLIHYTIFAFFINLSGIISNTHIFIISYIISNVSAFILALFGEMKYRSLSNYLKRKFIRESG